MPKNKWCQSGFSEKKLRSRNKSTLTPLILLLAFTLLSLMPATSFAQTASFGSATNFAVGNLPRSVAVGDFNGDGKPDLAVANYNNNTVSILLGTGPGTFGAATNFAVGSSPTSLVIADFNGDGKLDLAVANANAISPTVSILLGDGTGSFGAATSFATGAGPLYLAIGDLNGDGKLDLVTANGTANTVSILLGTGTGAFGAPSNYAVVGFPNAVAIGDVNGDGKPDLAVANFSSNTVSILLGSGTGSFGTPTNFAVGGTGPISVAIGDVNGDGKPDLAVANFSSNTVSILLGTGTGTFGAATNFAVGAGPNSMAIGDFNGDGKLDLAVANLNGNTVSILLGTGTGAFGAATTFGVGTNPYSVAIGDFNGDGKPDLVTTNSGTNNVSVLLNTTAFTPSGGFSGPSNFAAGANTRFFATADLNRDGMLDLVAVNNVSPGTISVLLATSPGNFGSASAYSVGSGAPGPIPAPFAVAIGDFNGDGIPDVVTANNPSFSCCSISVLLGTGTGAFNTASTISLAGVPAISVAVADFDGDGKQDIAVGLLNGQVAILLGNGSGGFGSPTNFTVGNTPISIAVADINLDGKLDLIVANAGDNTVSVLLGTGSGSFQPKVDFTFTSADAVAIGDFNRDGLPDLVVADNTGRTVGVRLGNGLPSLFGAVTTFPVPTPIWVAVADVNRDGKADIVVANNNSTFSVLTGDGAGSFSTATNYSTGANPSQILVADFNLDGKPDVATVSVSGNVSIFVNGALAPVISSLSPTFGPVGTSVTINGGDFGGTQGASIVTFNGVNAGSATSWDNCCITIPVPSGATTGPVVVTVNGVQSNNDKNFTVTVTTATKLGFTTQPSTAYEAATITPNVQVAVQDSSGITVTSSTANVTIAIGTNPSSGTLSGTATVAAVNGVATFSNLSINKAGSGYTFAASSPGLTGATSNAFDINAVLTASPSSRLAGPGGTAAYTVTVNGSGPVLTLSAFGLPPGASASFSTNPVTPPGTSTVTITTQGTTPTGTYTIDIQSTGGPQTFTASVSLIISNSVAGTVYVVNSNNDVNDGVCDSTHCSLREAINAANANAGIDTIQFNIANGLQTIAPTSPLPPITSPVIIDGTTQPGFAGTPIIELNGTGAGAGANGLVIAAGSSTVRGLVINRFNATGIRIQTTGGNVIAGNYIGTNAAGTVALGNISNGVLITSGATNNTIGGTTIGARNVISGHTSVSQLAGILITGAGTTGNLVQGNYIGTDATGTAAIANNSGVSLTLGASGNTVGGTSASARNVISGNASFGMLIRGATTQNNLIQGNFIGTKANGTEALPNLTGVLMDTGATGVTIGGANATPGGACTGACNVISGNGTGVEIAATNSPANANFVQGNYIGTDVTGTLAVANTTHGVNIVNTSNNLIGGATAATRNIISGNTNDGVVIGGSGATGNLVQGNYIGTNAAGTAAVANSANGVAINADNNTIGGTGSGARNVISGNTVRGVHIGGGTGNIVQGDYIGTNASGTAALPNGDAGVLLSSSSSNAAIGGTAGTTAGGPCTGACNLISGNTGDGVFLSFTTGHVVLGNYIGTNAAGTAAIPNNGGSGGIEIFQSPNNMIGGTTPGAGNLISGNATRGIEMSGASSTGNSIQGNYIGTEASGSSPLPNGISGIALGVGVSTNLIGGSANARNVIAFNTQEGIVLSPTTGTGNAILQNSIHDNGTLGIDLGANGVTPNDLGDADTGPNNLQNFPLLASAITGTNGTAIQGALNSTANTAFHLEFFANAACDGSGNGQGQTFLGTANTTTDGSGNASFSATVLPTVAGQAIAATATDPSNNTSEFSGCRTVAALSSIAVTPANPSINVGQTQQFTATGTYSDATSRPLSNGTWTATGSMGTARSYHSSVLLPNGKVLVAGGLMAGGSTSSLVNTADLYDPATGTYTATGSMTAARFSFTATVLQNGKVLVTGGNNASNQQIGSAELYDPATGLFTATGPMAFPRAVHTATLLSNGKVLIAGGNFAAAAEVYDPVGGTFSISGSMTTTRSGASATLLANGTVLIVGGRDSGNTSLASAELYDPTTGTFTPTTGSMPSVRDFHSATLLQNGRVLIAGGEDTAGNPQATALLYDPATGTFIAIGQLGTARLLHTATLLPSGAVLVAGGIISTSSAATANADLYVSATGTSFIPIGPLGTARGAQTANLLSNGQVLVAGGIVGTTNVGTTSAELFTPPDITWSSGTTATAAIDATGFASAFAAGTSTITATQVGGSITGSTTLTVTSTVTPDFTISSSPGLQTVLRGTSTTYTVTVGSTGGFNAAVTLSASGLPSGAGASFSPNPVSPPATSTLTLSTAYTTPTGTFSFAVQGQAGAVTHTVSPNPSVTVNNNAPVGGSQPTVNTPQNTAVVITLTATDLDNASLTFSTGTAGSGTLGTPSAPACVPVGAGSSCTTQVTYQPNLDYFGPDSFTFTASDGLTSSSAVQVNINVTHVNQPPVITPIGDKSLSETDLLNFTVAATDVDGPTPLTLSASGLPNGASFNAGTGQFTWTPDTAQAGTYFVHFQATDGAGASSAQDVSITVNDLLVDTDGDGVPDSIDNCPTVYNPDQSDLNHNGIGDVCEQLPTPAVATTGTGQVTATSTVSSTSPAPGQPIIVTATATFHPLDFSQPPDGVSDPYYVLRPTPYNVIVRVVDNTTGLVVEASRIPEGSFYSLPRDLVAVFPTPSNPNVSFSTQIDLSQWYPNLPPGNYTITSTYANFVKDPNVTQSGGCVSGTSCTPNIWLGAVNAGTVTVVVDSTAPLLTVPANMTVEATSAAGAVVTFVATATDNLDPHPTVMCSPASGSTFPLGTTTVTCTAKDASNNTSAPKTFTVTVRDTTAPTLTVPANITVNATSAAGAVVTYTVSATDAVTASPTITCSKASGTTFPIGTTTVSCTAKDTANNTSAAKSFTVTVKSAATQISDLIAKVNGLPGVSSSLKNSLTQKLQDAQKLLNQGNKTGACGKLNDFISAVQAQSGSGLTVAQANDLQADATRIKAVIGCP